VLDQFQSIGARVEDTAYGVLTRDGMPARFFGLIELQLPNVAGNDDFGLMVGLRGSYDQTLPRGLAVGSRVFVCDNLAFSGDVTIKTKQTTYIGQRLPRLIAQAVDRIPALASAQSAKFDAYRNTTIGQRAGDAMVLALRAQAGYSARSAKYVALPSGGRLLANPEPATVTGVRRARGFVYLNLNGGDSWGYYYPASNPEILYSFKGEPPVRLADIAPGLWERVRPRDPFAGVA
jgi:hypothetical protein